MSSYTHKDQVLFPNAIPESLDNYEHKKKSITEGLTVDSDAGLDNAMASLMTEYVKDTKNRNDRAILHRYFLLTNSELLCPVWLLFFSGVKGTCHGIVCKFRMH